ncbi:MULTISPECIES: ImmA/IrrE family metallo-endopeptidase [Siminovitchia]|uniref:ImmA/IrrE family metallo-endopeptidase n=1 Tax=Siminovitchia sediminis TaxID=1274353 RepID=A0ABW4KJ26_9BACI|nr:ImmA/IrrE family metallo-endopeptidase [Siminovitchia fortis]
MFFYCPTHLEEWISKWYINEGIIHPSDIDIEAICQTKDILYVEKPIFSHYVIAEDMKMIVVDERIEEVRKKEHFFHELFHVELHSGIQTSLPNQYRCLQEAQASNCSRYALIPYHMLKFIDFNSHNVIEDMQNKFKASAKICIERLAEIHRRITSNNSDIHNPQRKAN